METIRILLVDDHQLFRDGIKSLLEEESHLRVVREAENGQQALNLFEEQEIDLILCDLNMPVMGGVECVKQFRKKWPQLPILILTMADDELQIKQMLKSGASGYVLKNSSKAELILAIDSVITGELYYSPRVANIIMEDLAKNNLANILPHSPPGQLLSEREIEVLKLIANEYSNREISDKLFISVRTVDSHRRNLLQKTGAKNTAGLTRYALQHNLIQM